MQRDRLFSEPRKLGDFEFGESTAAVFDDMLERSVPFYHEIQEMVVSLATTFKQPGTRVYDLGCSTGTTLLQIGKRDVQRDVDLVGIDYSAPMLEQARVKLAAAGLFDRCELLLADVNDVAVENASVVVMILTLQFVRPLHREKVIRRIADGLVPQGVLLLVEKVLGNDSRLNRIFIDEYYEMKRKHGYSDLEIAQKREALENVLIPYRADENVLLLKENGFASVDTFFRWYNFAGLVAIKSAAK